LAFSAAEEEEEWGKLCDAEYLGLRGCSLQLSTQIMGEEREWGCVSSYGEKNVSTLCDRERPCAHGTARFPLD